MDLAPCPAPRVLEPDALCVRWVVMARALLAALGAWRLATSVGFAMYARVGAALVLVERLLRRFQAGRVWRVTPRAGTADRVVADAGSGRAVGARPHAALPRRFGWLVAMGGNEAACYGSQLQALLADPEMAAFVAACPQARRVLRPVCRALCVDLPWVVAPVVAGAVRDGGRVVRPRAMRPRPAPFRIPLPRGVLSAARQQGFGKWC